MKKNGLKRSIGMVMLLTAIMGTMAGCGDKDTKDSGREAQTEVSSQSGLADSRESDSSTQGSGQPDGSSAGQEVSGEDKTAGEEKTADGERAAGEELEVRFGDKGEPFMLKMNDSDTAAAIVRYVGTSDWRLPIYEDEEDADYDVMQYYDIPDRYEIPSAPEKITAVKAGEAYYSEPNRIVLYYQDAEVDEEYTPIGSFDATDEFIAAVRDNPVLEGWGNKIVLITKP